MTPRATRTTAAAFFDDDPDDVDYGNYAQSSRSSRSRRALQPFSNGQASASPVQRRTAARSTRRRGGTARYSPSSQADADAEAAADADARAQADETESLAAWSDKENRLAGPAARPSAGGSRKAQKSATSSGMARTAAAAAPRAPRQRSSRSSQTPSVDGDMDEDVDGDVNEGADVDVDDDDADVGADVDVDADEDDNDVSVSVTPRPARRSKRRRTEEPSRESSASLASQMAHEHEVEDIDTQFYDPDQDPNERRAVRKAIRDLAKQLNGSRSELLAPGDHGLLDTVKQANHYFTQVKQTSDATLDSRLLVSAADLSYKKTAQLNLGDAAQGIDVDEFVSKCISFMRHRGPAAAAAAAETPSSRRRRGASQQQPPPLSTQQPRRRGRPRRTTEGGDYSDADEGRSTTTNNLHGDDAEKEGAEDDDDDDGDALDWALLGRRACFPHNARPPVPGFLLGPLSLQKRARAPRSQRPRARRRDPADVERAQELAATDIEQVENSNLTVLCARILARLQQVQSEATAAAEADAEVEMEAAAGGGEDGLSAAQNKAILARHGMGDDGGIAFFNFVVNPYSFGQTVENLFYVSFLIRDGKAGIGQDSDGFPTIHFTTPRTTSECQEQGVQKKQAVFNLDWDTWEQLIEVFKITEPMIPHRAVEDDGEQAAAAGRWYG